MARLIREKQVSACEVMEAHLRQIEAWNPKINAIVTLDAEGALRGAREADAALGRGDNHGPLHGVPFTIKDVYETAGMRTTSGSRRLAGYIPRQDASVVARLRAAGAILIGKTNTPEFANDNQTDNRQFGRTNNPWDLSRTTGGSSGGAAAAIATGCSPLDIGGDLGGSIRRPAHYCGIYGMKPTDHLVPHTGHIPPPPGVRSWGMLRHLFSAGPLARSVADLRLALTLIAGADGHDPEVPPVSLSAPQELRPLRELRIAWTDDCAGVQPTAETRAALEAFAGQLQSLGCRVERCAPSGFDFPEALHTDGEVEQTSFFAQAHMPRLLLRVIARLWYSRDPLVSGYLSGAGSDLGRYSSALVRRDRYIDLLERFLENWDAWLLPVAPSAAFPHLPQTASTLKKLTSHVDIDGKPVSYMLASTGNMNIFNLTGSPVVVLPLAHTKEGLPIGVQVVGRRWMDMELLAVAGQLAEVIGPYQPPLK